MSYIELYIGTLIPIEGDPEKFAKFFMECYNCEFNKNYEFYLDQLIDEFYDKFIVLNNQLYRISNKEFKETEDISYHKVNDDQSIDYILQFYNSGCCLHEALKHEIENGK